VAGGSVAILRSAAGRDPHNRELSDLVGALATQSEAFRTRWAAHNVRFHNTGDKHFNHPTVGDLHLTYTRLDLAADPGLTLFTYTAEPGSRSEEALKLLGLGSHRRPRRVGARDRPKLRPTTTRSSSEASA
jgi:transcription regulator MmyB-like protein